MNQQENASYRLDVSMIRLEENRKLMEEHEARLQCRYERDQECQKLLKVMIAGYRLDGNVHEAEDSKKVLKRVKVDYKIGMRELDSLSMCNSNMMCLGNDGRIQGSSLYLS